MTNSKEKQETKKDENNNSNIINPGYKINFLPSKIAKSKVYHRPPIPEFPSKLFNVFKTKMIFKPYFISPAENLLFDSKQRDDEDSDYEFEKENKLTVKGIKKDINQIINIKKTVIELDKLYGYKICIYYIFLFLYDMTDYSSFETLLKYFERLNTKYDITNRPDIIPCIIGNKKDRNILFNEEQLKILNEFIIKNKLKHYEISTKPFYNFPKFYTQFIIDNLSPMHLEFQEKNFKEELKKVIENKPNFSKALRSPLSSNEQNPGYEYDLNIYSYGSEKEIKDAMMNKKTRFKRKIFVNKQGPIIYNSKSAKEVTNPEQKEKKNTLYITSGGILNKPLIGYTFGITEGKLNLVKYRRDLIKKRNKHITETIEHDLEELISEFNRLSVLIRDTNGSNLLLQENNVVIIDPDLYEIDYSKTIDELNIHNKQMILNYFYYKFMSCFRGYSFEYLHTMDRLFDIDIKEDTILSDEMRKKLVDEKPIDTIRKLKRELG